MENFDLLIICLNAFIAVFFVLGLLAGIMKLIMYFFPQTSEDDLAVLAAISAALHNAFPGMKILNIKEQ